MKKQTIIVLILISCLAIMVGYMVLKPMAIWYGTETFSRTVHPGEEWKFDWSYDNFQPYPVTCEAFMTSPDGITIYSETFTVTPRGTADYQYPTDGKQRVITFTAPTTVGDYTYMWNMRVIDPPFLSYDPQPITVHVVPAPTPTPTITPTPTAWEPTDYVPSPPIKIPGFGFISAFLGLFVMSYLAYQRKFKGGENL